jgi:DNA repair protein RecN (Recombination protein N)
MLESLSIKNFAIIDDLEVRFSSGFNVITGETGAGKSIMVQALGLTLGERADSTSLRDKTQKCVVELVMSLQNLSVQAFFQANDLDYANETIIRREINPEGKSRAFINDTPVNLAVLKEFSRLIVDLHSQHQNLDAADSQFRLRSLDQFAGNSALLLEIGQLFKQLDAKKRELRELQQKEAELKRNLDFNQFQWNELEEAKLSPGMVEELETEQKRLENTGEIKTLVIGAVDALQNGDFTILSNLNTLKGFLSSLSKLDESTLPYLERVQTVLVDLKDLVQELDSYGDSVVDNPARLDEVNERLDKVYRLLRKHNLQQVEQLLSLQTQLEEAISKAENFDAERTRAESEVEKALQAYKEVAQKLSIERSKYATVFAKLVSNVLVELSMPNAQFEIQVQTLPEPSPLGMDAIYWMFSSNKGSELKDASKAASGGELSRLMLAIKASLAQKAELPSLILDEIDTGVSGEVASRIANLMKGISQKMQVVAITHLPQVAARAHHHLFVFKGEIKGKTTTQIRILSPEEKVSAVAAMLSDGKVSAPAMENARALIEA